MFSWPSKRPASGSPPGREFGERNQAAFFLASASTSTPIMSLSFIMRYSTPSILTSVPDHLPNRMRSPTLTSIGMSLPLSSRPPGPTAMTLPCCGSLGGVGNDYATSGLRLGVDSLDDNSVVKRSEFHWCPPTVLSKSLAVFESWSLFRKQFLVGSISGPLRSGGLIERLGHACLDWFGSLSRYLLSERAKLLHSARKRYRIACDGRSNA